MLVDRGAESYRLVVESLQAGKVVVMACDTIYGFVGRAPETESMIRTIKGRGDDKPFLRLLSDPAELTHHGAAVPDPSILDLWPGPFTLIFSISGGGTAAFRVPEDRRLRQIVREVGSALYSTSVNRSGSPALSEPTEIHREFGSETALVENAGELGDRVPSTILDCRRLPGKILRQGAGIVPAHFAAQEGG